MIVEVDVGNTRCKWRAQDDGSVARRGDDLESLCRFLRGSAAVERIRAVSVLGPDRQRDLVDRIVAAGGVRPAFAQAQAECNGLRCGYAQPEQLGADRWVAILAAHHRYSGPLWVVDAGSALTLDLLDGEGCHLGGYIVPGRRLMGDALLEGTGRVRYDRQLSVPVAWAPGTDTAGCVAGGCAMAMCGVISAAYGMSRAGFRAVPRLVLTGGDALLVREGLELLGFDDALLLDDPELVFDGLGLALP